MIDVSLFELQALVFVLGCVVVRWYVFGDIFPQVRDQVIAQEYFISWLNLMVFELGIDGSSGVLCLVFVGFEFGDIFPQVRDQVIAQEYFIFLLSKCYFFDVCTSLNLFFCFVFF